MLPPNLLNALAQANVQDESLAQLFRLVTALDVKSQTRLVQPCVVYDTVYFVVQGAFVCRDINDDVDITKTINFYIDDLRPFMSCVDSFFTDEKTRCELRAVNKSHVLCIKKADLMPIIAQEANYSSFATR